MNTSGETLEQVLGSLVAATEGRTPFTLGFLGTTGADGGPRVRAVIVREVDRAAGRLMVATNTLSRKVAEIDHQPRVALTFYDDDRGVQLRIRGDAAVVDDEKERRRAWERFSPSSRHLYASRLVPGTPLPDRPADGPDDDETAVERFAWIRIDMTDLDWLDLSGDPHIRWQFTRDGGGWHGQEIVP
ncbi:pyridoxamine 5'-phosphate oxidase family protein [Paenarthrobacter sp. AR 02]|uniref:pyridoxamine 5'-phosphate oxidase family protein n=1 Tax=Paenarthrobacter sp. AR 02 TaxID=2899821 RepID=UPI001F2F33BC|nr:pyridoxamine 5'-phosphate oxidase family protein [Paenarthrobacter sp. AR 02]MCF3138337.1 pyridoxamine 5'-phosphate oxidase family protein [Paenarthrobacter sp. AR 02]